MLCFCKGAYTVDLANNLQHDRIYKLRADCVILTNMYNRPQIARTRHMTTYRIRALNITF